MGFRNNFLAAYCNSHYTPRKKYYIPNDFISRLRRVFTNPSGKCDKTNIAVSAGAMETIYYRIHSHLHRADGSYHNCFKTKGGKYPCGFESVIPDLTQEFTETETGQKIKTTTVLARILRDSNVKSIAVDSIVSDLANQYPRSLEYNIGWSAEDFDTIGTHGNVDSSSCLGPSGSNRYMVLFLATGAYFQLPPFVMFFKDPETQKVLGRAWGFLGNSNRAIFVYNKYTYSNVPFEQVGTMLQQATGYTSLGINMNSIEPPPSPLYSGSSAKYCPDCADEKCTHKLGAKLSKVNNSTKLGAVLLCTVCATEVVGTTKCRKCEKRKEAEELKKDAVLHEHPGGV
jgi:hypothetical protein